MDANAQALFQEVDTLLDRWLTERTDLINAFHAASERPEDDLDSAPLAKFCNILVDYVSAGHFEVFQKLVAEAKSFEDQQHIVEALSILPEISATTEVALEFNDHFEAAQDKLALEIELATMRDVLATRFALEDRLIDILHASHEVALN
ncbi:MAG: hypothetical protein RL336_407 [Pseudomonadota bacterium]|jgi:regulator of sigma D